MSPHSAESFAFLPNHWVNFLASSRIEGLEARQALQIEKPTHHEGLLRHIDQGSPEESPESMFFFGFSPELFDLFPGSLTQVVKNTSLPHADSGVFFLGPDRFASDVRLNLSFDETPNELLLKESLVIFKCQSLNLDASLYS